MKETKEAPISISLCLLHHLFCSQAKSSCLWSWKLELWMTCVLKYSK
jgi:hypothetical protein